MHRDVKPEEDQPGPRRGPTHLRIQGVFCLCVLLATGASPGLRAQAIFGLGFDCPACDPGPETERQPESLTTLEVVCTLETRNLPPRFPGAQGWDLGLRSRGARIVDISVSALGNLADTAAIPALATGFEHTELTPARDPETGELLSNDSEGECEGLDGAVSSVILSLGDPIALDAGPVHTILNLHLETTVPAAGEDCVQAVVEFVDGCQGTLPPLTNTVLYLGNPLTPIRSDLSVDICPSTDPCDDLAETVSLMVQDEAIVRDFGGLSHQSADAFDGLLSSRVEEDAPIAVLTPVGEIAEVTVYAALVSKDRASGVQGWTLAASLGGDFRLVAATVLGTASEYALSFGFERTELIDPGLEPAIGPLSGLGPQGPGVVSSVLLSYDDAVTLALTSTATVLALDLESTLPQGGNFLQGELNWVDGLNGPGQPIHNRVTARDATRSFCATQSARLVSRPPAKAFIRGDANSDGSVNIADPSFVANFIFGIPPATEPPCRAAADGNGDGGMNIADVSFIANFVFGIGAATPPPRPFPDCAISKEDPLPCAATSPQCE